jgi:hypothetical protein
MIEVQATRKDTSAARCALPALRGWKTFAYAKDAGEVEIRKQEIARAFRDDAKHVVFRTRDKNPGIHMHVPPEVWKLGTVLDLTVLFHNVRTVWSELDGWQLLSDPDAFDRGPGEAELYLVRAPLQDVPPDFAPLSAPQRRAARKAYERWNEREPDYLNTIEIPPIATIYVGRATAIGYHSTKWDEAVDYNHDFAERRRIPPDAWSDNVDLAQANVVVLTGGDMRITEEGID